MRKLIVLFVFALFAAACGGSADSAPAADTTATSETPAPASSDTTTTSESVDTTASPAADESGQTETTAAAGPSFDGPPAPDFELALADGSTFQLSDEQKPVYLVFWAEW